MSGRNEQRKPGTARGSPRRSRTAKAPRISRLAVKSRCAHEGDGWGRISDDGSGHYNPNPSEDPWGGGVISLHGGAQSSLWPDTVRITALTPRCTKGGCKLDDGQRMPGAGLSCRRSRKAPLGKPTFQPYWGKPAVRNDREDRGNVGIIRSPLRASILPDFHYRKPRLLVMAVISPRSNGWPQENQPGCIKKNILRDLFVP